MVNRSNLLAPVFVAALVACGGTISKGPGGSDGPGDVAQAPAGGTPMIAEAADTVGGFAIGDSVLCHWKGAEAEYPGQVAHFEGERIFIEYDDGDTELIDPALCQHKNGSAPSAVAALGDGPLSGMYDIVGGRNPDGGTYTGAVSIGHDGSAVRLVWRLQGGGHHGGVGLLVGDLLGVGWGAPESHGVVVYKVDGGNLSGRWASAGTGGTLGTEELKGPAGLNGVYQIVNGQGPDGSQYQGEVEIHPKGSTYELQWRLTNEEYDGVGLLKDGTLFVGWGANDVGIVLYETKGDSLKGIWAPPPGSGGNALGVENLKRH